MESTYRDFTHSNILVRSTAGFDNMAGRYVWGKVAVHRLGHARTRKSLATFFLVIYFLFRRFRFFLAIFAGRVFGFQVSFGVYFRFDDRATQHRDVFGFVLRAHHGDRNRNRGYRIRNRFVAYDFRFGHQRVHYGAWEWVRRTVVYSNLRTSSIFNL